MMCEKLSFVYEGFACLFGFFVLVFIYLKEASMDLQMCKFVRVVLSVVL